MATNRETYKTDEQLARAFDWHCNAFDCYSCKHSTVKQKYNSRSHCFLAWQKDEANADLLALEPCRFCGEDAHLAYGDAVISCSKCGYELRETYFYRKNAKRLYDSVKKLIGLWNKLQKGS